MAKPERLSPKQVSETEDLDDWRVLLDTLQSSFKTGSMAKGLEFAGQVGTAADEANHHPDLTVTYPRVHVLLTTHEAKGLSQRDIEMARQISSIARDLEIEAEPAAATLLDISIDAMDIDAVKPFWEAILGYKPGQPHDSSDPYSRGPGLWFQQMDEPRTERNRIHFDVVVPHDVAQQRIDAALAAGGTLVSDKAAPAFWILADSEGNEACICTWQGRE